MSQLYGRSLPLLWKISALRKRQLTVCYFIHDILFECFSIYRRAASSIPKFLPLRVGSTPNFCTFSRNSQEQRPVILNNYQSLESKHILQQPKKELDQKNNEKAQLSPLYSCISLLCNEFIVVELTRRKAQLERTADRKALVYLTAIANVQKYPLPIICPCS